MTRTIYHGSANIIERPVYGKGKTYNDYGVGFYCTESIEMAKEWAVARNRDGYANCYELNCEGLSFLDLCSAEFTILHWLTILLQNREFDMPSALAGDAKDYLLQHFYVDYSQCDVMIGYRADDSYFSFAQDFINGTISLRQLNKAMHLGKMGQQVVLKRPQAFDQITFIDAPKAACAEWYAKRMLRDRRARRDYFDLEQNRRKKGDIYITHILDEEMKADDERIRQSLFGQSQDFNG